MHNSVQTASIGTHKLDGSPFVLFAQEIERLTSKADTPDAQQIPVPRVKSASRCRFLITSPIWWLPAGLILAPTGTVPSFQPSAIGNQRTSRNTSHFKPGLKLVCAARIGQTSIQVLRMWPQYHDNGATSCNNYLARLPLIK